MKYFISNLLEKLKLNKKCKHESVSPAVESAYCPDCGQYIQNQWYITRCACCGLKLKSMIQNDEVRPYHNYCSNCGSSNYIVEKLPKINFIDINFAVLIKKIISEQSRVSTIQCWQEKISEPPKLLVRYQ